MTPGRRKYEFLISRKIHLQFRDLTGLPGAVLPAGLIEEIVTKRSAPLGDTLNTINQQIEVRCPEDNSASQWKSDRVMGSLMPRRVTR